MQDKMTLRREMRARRRDFVASLPEQVRGLILSRPPQAVVDRLAGCRTIGFYHPVGDEAPAVGWARWFAEQGHRIALPRFDDAHAPMEFALWTQPWDDSEIEPGPFRAMQPRADTEVVQPDAVIVPLLAFTESGHRLGQGGGHYDRWLEAHGPVTAIGLAWDVQVVDSIPLETHDMRLDGVVTPTRIYWSE
ncbi:5-formyltetrahydrofolate cyclo-ligase [Parerythrobacter lacustris]|uniref:5-formyltetrahydrofolate cyclo-ligase n=1 Tax=Parerythrobacter lacustris TaxID=2969984 RepID=A0ABT1XTN8_9SPHN|nr:5-formyltetrahydrofolate cyclo-ligase [Parerythrobacter lacustris]MCR2834030.1 5-formyltetrahydrofolate cyclo-ligase [Parerythrobacter lacustris]